MLHGPHYSRLRRVATMATDALRVNGWTLNQIDPDGLRYVAIISVRAHWLIIAVLLFEVAYRPYLYFWVARYVPIPLILLVLIGFNGYIHHRLRAGRLMTWHWPVALYALDVLLISAGAVLREGFSHPFIHLFYYPVLAGLAVLFTSFRFNMVWATMVSVVYVAISLSVGDGLDIEAKDEKALLARVVVMYAVVAAVDLATGFERLRWRRSVERERALHDERVELSQAIHDTAAQSAYMIGMGISAARTLSGDSNAELTATLEATSRLCRSIILELRHPINVGGIYEGRELSWALWSHVSSFTNITSVPVNMTHTGVESSLSMEVRSALFSVAHNALTNAYRHAEANNVGVDLEFAEECSRLSVSDDGVGLPDDYAERGNGFANMRKSAERLGGHLVVEQRGAMGGATVTCVIPRELYTGRRTGMSTGERTKVMIVDDHAIVRFGLQQVLELSGEFEVVGQASDGEEAVRVAAEVSPDVVVMDVMMPKKDGVEACREIMESAPEVRVVMLTAATTENAVVEAVAAGASGYLQKETDMGQLLSALRGAALGNFSLPPEIVRRAFTAIRGDGSAGNAGAAAGLTEREREILVSFARGMTYAQIAEARGVRPLTVRNAIYGIQEKLSLENMQGLVIWSVRNGLLDDYANG